MNIEEQLEFDKYHIWHPYSSMTNPLEPYLVESAKGVYLNLAGNKKVIDGMSSWWAVVNGYNHPYINEAIKNQIDKMSHVMFGGLTHSPAIELAKKILSIVPENLKNIFYCDSGSVSVEVAMKMALQYWHSKGKKDKVKFATIRGGYHGDTWNAMSVCDPVNGMHSIFNDALNINFFADCPKTKFNENFDESDIESLKNILENNSEKIAALILEPIVQGAGGMRFYSPEYLKQAKALCKKNNVLLILDEIATGFGRSGKMFACEYANVQPDIMCIGKAITGGYMSFAATLTSLDVANTISSVSPKVFMHGPTFMANPLACAAANASFDLIAGNKNSTLLKIANIQKYLEDGLLQLNESKCVQNARVLGAIGVVEMKENIDVKKAQSILIENGVWLRPFGRLLYTMPPYICEKSHIDKITYAMRKVVEKLS